MKFRFSDKLWISTIKFPAYHNELMKIHDFDAYLQGKSQKHQPIKILS